MQLIQSWMIAPLAFAALVTSSGSRLKAELSNRTESADSAAVAAVVAGFHSALSSGDSVRALSLLAPDVVVLESGGVETRAEYRSHHLSADIAFASAVPSRRGPLSVTVSGSTAWTTATSTTEGDFRGRKINSTGAESMVLTKDSTGWRIRSIHWSSANRRTSNP